MDSFSPFERLSRSSSTLSPNACKSSFISLLETENFLRAVFYPSLKKRG